MLYKIDDATENTPKDFETLDKISKENYLKKLDQTSNESLEKVRALSRKLASLQNELKSSQGENKIKVGQLQQKTAALQSAKQKFKTLLNQTDSGILDKAEIMEEKLEQLEEVMRKKKLIKAETKIASSLTTQRCAIIEEQCEKLEANKDQLVQKDIDLKKEALLKVLQQKYHSLETQYKHLKELSKTARKSQQNVMHGYRHLNTSKAQGKYYKCDFTSFCVDNLQEDLQSELYKKYEEQKFLLKDIK